MDERGPQVAGQAGQVLHPAGIDRQSQFRLVLGAVHRRIGGAIDDPAYFLAPGELP